MAVISGADKLRAINTMTENRGPTSLDAHVRRLVMELHLTGFSNRDSRLMSSGWVDWVIQGQHGTLFRELKSERGELDPDQHLVGIRLRRHGCNWDVWRPADLVTGRIRRELEAIL